MRQLFEPVLRRATDAERRTLLAGAAGLAAPVVDVRHGHASAGGLPSDLHAVRHGLYWLTANLAERGPLLLAVDDLHWSDVPSLRYLLYIATRMDGLGVLVALTARPGEAGADRELISQIVAVPSARLVRPAVLTVEAVGRLVRARLGGAAAAADDEFVTACLKASGGVPFLVHELLRALAADGVGPTAAAAGRVTTLGPKAVAHATLLRVSRLEPPAAAVAQAVAVLGRHADIRRVAALVGAFPDDTLAAADALTGVQILRPGRPLGFVHPVVRAAVYDDLPAGARSVAHARAAGLLQDEAADADEIATHLLLTEPGSAHEVIGTMRVAAAGALLRGAPESAIAHLRRALAEATTRTTRAALLHELGCAEAVVRDNNAVADLQEALRLTEQPAGRARVAHDLAEILVFAGHWEASNAAVQAGLAELGPADADIRARLEALRTAQEIYDPRSAARFEGRRAQLHALAEHDGPGARTLALLLAVAAALRTERLDEIVALVERGLDAGRLIADEGAGAWIFGQPVGALVVVDALDRADRLVTEMVADARVRGSVPGLVMSWTVRTCVAGARGELETVEADLRSGLELAGEHGMVMLFTVMLRWATDALLERPQLDDLVAVVETIELQAPFSSTMTGAMLLHVRGRLRLAANRTEDGIDDLRRCGEIADALGCDNPNGWATWRAPLALALRTEDPTEAARLVADELELARRTGLPRTEGVALRVAGLIEQGERGIELLRRSEEMLRRAPSPLEHARTLVELGAALRCANQRAAARDPLRIGVDLAHRCGAQRLAARAAEELRATGARPRRMMVRGRDALTPSERRVAQMAADGLTNRDIAQALFVTTKTIENQLGSIYRKLGVPGRTHLAVTLSALRPDRAA